RLLLPADGADRRCADRRRRHAARAADSGDHGRRDDRRDAVHRPARQATQLTEPRPPRGGQGVVGKRRARWDTPAVPRARARILGLVLIGVGLVAPSALAAAPVSSVTANPVSAIEGMQFTAQVGTWTGG